MVPLPTQCETLNGVVIEAAIITLSYQRKQSAFSIWIFTRQLPGDVRRQSKRANRIEDLSLRMSWLRKTLGPNHQLNTPVYVIRMIIQYHGIGYQSNVSNLLHDSILPLPPRSHCDHRSTGIYHAPLCAAIIRYNAVTVGGSEPHTYMHAYSRYPHIRGKVATLKCISWANAASMFSLVEGLGGSGWASRVVPVGVYWCTRRLGDGD